MATIIDFKRPAKPQAVLFQIAPPQGPAKLLLFTGVRYERQDQATDDAHRGRRNGRKSAHTNVQE